MLRAGMQTHARLYANTNRRRRYLLVILLLLGLEGGLGNTVQVTLAGLCDAAATLVLVDLNDADLLERLEDLAVDGAGGVNVVGGAGTAVLGGTAIISMLCRLWWCVLKGMRTRGPCGDGQHRRSCACRRGGRRRQRGRRTSRCPGEAARWSLLRSLAFARVRCRICVQNLRDVLTVSTQPVDKTVSELIVQLSPSDGIQVLSFTRWNSTNLGLSLSAIVASQLPYFRITYMGSFPCLFKKAA